MPKPTGATNEANPADSFRVRSGIPSTTPKQIRPRMIPSFVPATRTLFASSKPLWACALIVVAFMAFPLFQTHVWNDQCVVARVVVHKR